MLPVMAVYPYAKHFPDLFVRIGHYPAHDIDAQVLCRPLLPACRKLPFRVFFSKPFKYLPGRLLFALPPQKQSLLEDCTI